MGSYYFLCLKWETKVEKGGQEFEQISKTIKEEMKVFDFNRVKEFKVKLVKYLENLLSSQEQVCLAALCR